MAVDYNALVNQLIAEAQKNPALIEKAKKDPAAAIKEVTGITVTNDQLLAAYKEFEGKVDMKQAAAFLAQFIK